MAMVLIWLSCLVLRVLTVLLIIDRNVGL